MTVVEREETITVEMHLTEMETVETEETIMEETHATDVKEMDVMDAMDTMEMGILTKPLATSNDLRGLPPSVRR